jgi:Xaa-Pro aminopeptidase
MVMNKQEYIRRRQKLFFDVKHGKILLFGNKLVPRNYPANTYSFRQDSNLLYFTGIDLPGFCLVLDCDTNEEILFGYDPDMEDTIWSGPQKSLGQVAQRSGIDRFRPFVELSAFIKQAKKGKHAIHYLPPYPHERQLFLAEVLELKTDEPARGFSTHLVKSVITQREIKSKIEVAEIENVLNEVTGPIHIAAMKMAVSGNTEALVMAEMQRIVKQKQLDFAYETICTVRGETLHNIRYPNPLKKGQMLLVDAGVEGTHHYASDITRTTPVDGKFSAQQLDIYNIVLEAQTTIIDAVRPGIRYIDLHLKAANIIADGLIALGLMKGRAGEAVAEGAHALFFPHGLGHMLGLDVHDMEDLGENHVGYNDSARRSEQFGTAYLRLARELKPGFVFTVEPGIYFIPALIEQWAREKKHNKYIDYQKLDKYMNFGGIRIEDNIYVRQEGGRVLGKPIPKRAEEIETVCAG